MATIAVAEDMLGYGTAQVFLTNIIICGCVVAKLDNGFIGMHFTPVTTSEEISTGVNFAARILVPLGGNVRQLVFFVNESEWTEEKVRAETATIAAAFGFPPTFIRKPLSEGQSLDVRLSAPTGISSAWIAVRPHIAGTVVANPTSPHLYRVRKTVSPPVVDVARIQTLPEDLTTGWTSIH